MSTLVGLIEGFRYSVALSILGPDRSALDGVYIGLASYVCPHLL